MVGDASERNTDIWVFSLVAVVFVVLSWIFLPDFLSSAFSKTADKGAYGDKFGSVNALFTGLAFVGLVATILLQRKELVLQRKELELTREELKGQKEQLRNQSDIMKQQRFENTFFELLRVHIDIVSALRRVGKNGEKMGRECLADQLGELRREYKNHADRDKNLSPSDVQKIAYAYFFNCYPPHLGHYFRLLYHIVLFVDNSKLPDAKLYVNFVQAQLSHEELVLLAYNGLSQYGYENFKPLIEKYAMLENISPGTLLDPTHASLYEPAAFGSKPYQHER